MITITVAGPDAERKKMADTIYHMVSMQGKIAARYPVPDLKPDKYPEGLEVAVFESKEEPNGGA